MLVASRLLARVLFDGLKQCVAPLTPLARRHARGFRERSNLVRRVFDGNLLLVVQLQLCFYLGQALLRFLAFGFHGVNRGDDERHSYQHQPAIEG